MYPFPNRGKQPIIPLFSLEKYLCRLTISNQKTTDDVDEININQAQNEKVWSIIVPRVGERLQQNYFYKLCAAKVRKWVQSWQEKENYTMDP